VNVLHTIGVASSDSDEDSGLAEKFDDWKDDRPVIILGKSFD
jgi:hypothetical protein